MLAEGALLSFGPSCRKQPGGLVAEFPPEVTALGEARRRLDLEMVRRGITRSRSEAEHAIRAGKVAIEGRPAGKPGTLVRSSQAIALSESARRFVSRGGDKLEAALTRVGVDPAGKLALDAGASTGGFTDCLLTHGAEHVIAVDVGYGQLAWSLRQDSRVTVLERTNVRSLEPSMLPYAPGLITVDLSFISLRAALQALVRCADPRAEFVFLVKPQFEAGRQEVRRGGVVLDPRVWARVLGAVWDACALQGVVPRALMASPLVGPAGNVEFLLHASRDGTDGENGSAAQRGDDAAPGLEAGLAIRKAVEEGRALAMAHAGDALPASGTGEAVE